MKKKLVGTVLMYLSKLYDCLSHDLLIAKLDAYGFDKEALRLKLSYFKSGRKQSTKSGGCFSILKLILCGIPQGLILGPVLFDIFINGILLLTSNLHNFDDDNTITTMGEIIQDLVNIVLDKAEKAIKWLNINDTIW